jgi:hypothetical protein
LTKRKVALKEKIRQKKIWIQINGAFNVDNADEDKLQDTAVESDQRRRKRRS